MWLNETTYPRSSSAYITHLQCAKKERKKKIHEVWKIEVKHCWHPLNLLSQMWWWTPQNWPTDVTFCVSCSVSQSSLSYCSISWLGLPTSHLESLGRARLYFYFRFSDWQVGRSLIFYSYNSFCGPSLSKCLPSYIKSNYLRWLWFPGWILT